MDAAQALHNAGLSKPMLDGPREGVGNIHLLGGHAHRKQVALARSQNRQNAQRVVRLPRDVHHSPFDVERLITCLTMLYDCTGEKAEHRL